MQKGVIAVICCLPFVLSACGGAASNMATDSGAAACSAESKTYIGKAEALLKKWDDENVIASKSPRIALGSSVSNLSAIKREVDALSPPSLARVL
jgi:hypothetical protein